MTRPLRRHSRNGLHDRYFAREPKFWEAIGARMLRGLETMSGHRDHSPSALLSDSIVADHHLSINSSLPTATLATMAAPQATQA